MRRVRRLGNTGLLLRPLHRLNPLLIAQPLRSRRLNLRRAAQPALSGHSITRQTPLTTRNRLDTAIPRPQPVFRIVEHLPRVLGAGVRRALFAGHDGRVVEKVYQPAGLLREKDLFLGPLDHRRRVQIVGFFEFLAGDVCELRFGDEGLRFGAHEFLLEGDEFRGLGLFVLEFLDLVLDLWGDASVRLSRG